MQFFWPHAMKGHTFYESENNMQPIGGHRFRWDAQHVGFTKDANRGFGEAVERQMRSEDGAAEDDDHPAPGQVYAVYADPLVGAHQNPQT